VKRRSFTPNAEDTYREWLHTPLARSERQAGRFARGQFVAPRTAPVFLRTLMGDDRPDVP
jgi:hypothetical protein